MVAQIDTGSYYHWHDNVLMSNRLRFADHILLLWRNKK